MLLLKLLVNDDHSDICLDHENDLDIIVQEVIIFFMLSSTRQSDCTAERNLPQELTVCGDAIARSERN